MHLIFEAVEKFGMIAVFILIMLEYACFPVPSEVVLPFSGAIASSNNTSLISVLLISTLAGYLGAVICYAIGYYGGSSILVKTTNKFPRTKKSLDYSRDLFNKHSNISVSVGRVIPLCRTYISLIAGSFKQDFFKFSMFSLMGIFIWNTVLISLGYFLADNWEIVTLYYQKYKLILIILISLLTIITITYIIYKNKGIKEKK